MHRNFTSSQEIVDAYTAFLPKATLMDLDTEEVPVIISPVAGQSVHLSLRGVIGFSQFVRRIIIISDTHLIKTTSAEDEFFAKNLLVGLFRTSVVILLMPNAKLQSMQIKLEH